MASTPHLSKWGERLMICVRVPLQEYHWTLSVSIRGVVHHGQRRDLPYCATSASRTLVVRYTATRQSALQLPSVHFLMAGLGGVSTTDTITPPRSERTKSSGPGLAYGGGLNGHKGSLFLLSLRTDRNLYLAHRLRNLKGVTSGTPFVQYTPVLQWRR